MKKFFTLIAAVAMAASVSAQGTYAVPENFTPASGGTVTSVPNITMTWGIDTWTASSKVDSKFETQPTFLYKTLTSHNPAYDSELKTVPVSGCYVKFEPKITGVVTVAYKLNKNNKTQYFVDGEGNNVVDPILNSDASNSIYLLTDMPVTAGKTYYTYTRGAKMDFFGFVFKEGTATGITSINAASTAKADVLYNLAGQQVSKSYKGIVVKNGKKFLNK